METSSPVYTPLCRSLPALPVALQEAKHGLGPYVIDGSAKLLGSGFTGRVFRVRDTRNGERCAAKFFPNTISSAWDAHIFAEAARRLAGRGVVPELKGRYYICDGSWLVIVMSLLVPLQAKAVGAHKRYAQSMRRCLKEFHDAGFAHGDVHMDNFMIDPLTDTVRLIDFGLSYDYRVSDAERWFLPKVPRGKRTPDIKDWTWITSRIDPKSADSLRVADFLIDSIKLETIIDLLGL